MKNIRWTKYYLGIFLLAPFVFSGITKELGPFTGNRLCTACHTMESVKEEYYKAGHFKNPSGVQAGCVECHLKDGLISFSGANLLLKDAIIEVFNPASTKEEFEKRRARLASGVRNELLKSDSANCRNCHVQEAVLPTKIQGKNAHEKMKTQKKTCIDCHYNLAHKKVPWPEKEKVSGELEGLF